MKQLEEKSAKDMDRVNDLLDRARHNDIPPGELRRMRAHPPVGLPLIVCR